MGIALESLANSLLRCSLPGGGRMGRVSEMRSQSQHGGLVIGIRAPDRGNSRENELFSVGEGHT